MQDKSELEKRQDYEAETAHFELIAALQYVRDRYERYLTRVTMLNLLPHPDQPILPFPDWLKGATKDLARWSEVFE
jgi:hypothetical protein